MQRSLIRYMVLVLALGVLATRSATSVIARVAPATAPLHAAPASPIPLAWGSNTYGQLGDGNPTPSPVPVPVPVDTTGMLKGKTITALATGYFHSLALDSTGTVYSWGNSNYGQLGTTSTTGSPVPVAVDTSGVLNGKTLVAIAAGGYHSLALDSTGLVYGWGQNDHGQIGNDSVPQSLVPVAVYAGGVLSGKTITAITAGYDFSLALDSTGLVYAWGANDSGQLGNNTQTSGGHAVAVDTSGVLAGKKIIAIAAGGYHSLALDSTGLVYAWGANDYGQLGYRTTSPYSAVPVAVDTTGVLSGKTITAIAAGSLHSLALDSTGLVYAWGGNADGQLGNGDNSGTNQSVPNAVFAGGALAGKTITALGGGYYDSLALDSTGLVYAWGDDSAGQLGDGGSGSSHVPVATSLPITQHVTVLSVGSQGNHTLALAHTGGPTLDDDIRLAYDFKFRHAPPIIAEGWLHVVPDPKNPANSSGTFTDNLAGGKTYPVTYNGATLQFTLNTIYGKFVLTSAFRVVSYPTRFGAGATFTLPTPRPHHDTTATYTTFTAFPSEGYGPEMAGQLVLTFDNNDQNYIVPDNLKAGHPSRLVGTIGGKAFVAPITQAALYEHIFTGDYSLIFTAKIAGQLYHFQSYWRQTTGPWGTYYGLAYADGATKHGVVYEWQIE